MPRQRQSRCPSSNSHVSLALTLTLALATTLALAPPAARAQQKAAVVLAPAGKPFNYAPLKIRNSCMVESVRFYDTFHTPELGGAAGWVRVLQWGNATGSLHPITLGHAVAVCLVRDALWMYDVNFGFVPLGTPVAKRDDLAAIETEVLAKYRQTNPGYLIYHPGLLPVQPQLPQILAYITGNADVREATKAASELGRHRATRVVGFVHHNNRARGTEQSAAAVFEFDRHLCVYFPSQGTLTTELHPDSLENVRRVAAIIAQVYPGATDIEWHDSGPWRVLQKTAPATPPAPANILR